jgi:hypothetical protein
MNSVLILPELRAMEQTGQIGSVLSNNQYDSVFGSGDPAAVDWPLALECLHHWDVLAGQGAALGGGNVSSKLDVVTDMIDTALGLYDVLQRAGVVFEAASGPRNLVVWGRALDTFRTDFGI